MYQIIRYQAQYCPIRGGMTGGSKAVRLPMTYRNRTLAEKLASRMHQEDYDGGGDDSYGVKAVGESAYPVYSRSVSRVTGRPLEEFDTIPF